MLDEHSILIASHQVSEIITFWLFYSTPRKKSKKQKKDIVPSPGRISHSPISESAREYLILPGFKYLLWFKKILFYV